MTKVNEGGCLCGSVRYRVKGDPVLAAACHCKLCQLRTGSAFGIAVYFEATQIEFTSGSLRPYKFRSDESGRWVQTEFCETCGTTVTWTAEFLPGHRAIAGGTFDDPNWVRIDRHVWTRSAHRWMVFPSDVGIFPTTSLKRSGLMQEQPATTYTCQREGCNSNADYKLVHKRYDTLFQYICDEHLNDDLGYLMREEYIPVKITEREGSSG